MSLWTIFFPGYLIDIFGVWNLPLIAVPLYLYIFYALYIYPSQRIGLIAFLFLTAMAIGINVDGVRPNSNDIIKPLSLLAVMMMPVLISVFQILKKNYQLVLTWLIVALAGWALSLSWVLWLYAMAKS